MTTAKLKGPENHGGFSHQGVSYEPDADGIVEVPHEAVEAAFSHGFALVAGKTKGTSGISTAAEIEAENLGKLNKKQLVAFGEKFELELDESKTNKELIAEIQAEIAKRTSELPA